MSPVAGGLSGEFASKCGRASDGETGAPPAPSGSGVRQLAERLSPMCFCCGYPASPLLGADAVWLPESHSHRGFRDRVKTQPVILPNIYVGVEVASLYCAEPF